MAMLYTLESNIDPKDYKSAEEYKAIAGEGSI